MPCPQLTQAAAPRMVEYVPAGQPRQTVADAAVKSPDLHRVQLVRPHVDAKLPAWHALQADMPPTGWYVPAAQGLQGTVLPAALKLPATQSVHPIPAVG